MLIRILVWVASAWVELLCKVLPAVAHLAEIDELKVKPIDARKVDPVFNQIIPVWLNLYATLIIGAHIVAIFRQIGHFTPNLTYLQAPPEMTLSSASGQSRHNRRHAYAMRM